MLEDVVKLLRESREVEGILDFAASFAMFDKHAHSRARVAAALARAVKLVDALRAFLGAPDSGDQVIEIRDRTTGRCFEITAKPHKLGERVQAILVERDGDGKVVHRTHFYDASQAALGAMEVLRGEAPFAGEWSP